MLLILSSKRWKISLSKSLLNNAVFVIDFCNNLSVRWNAEVSQNNFKFFFITNTNLIGILLTRSGPRYDCFGMFCGSNLFLSCARWYYTSTDERNANMSFLSHPQDSMLHYLGWLSCCQWNGVSNATPWQHPCRPAEQKQRTGRIDSEK